MADMDGWSTLTALKADPELASIPVILLTFVDNRNKGFALGAPESLSKPIDPTRLATVINRFKTPPPFHPGPETDHGALGSSGKRSCL